MIVVDFRRWNTTYLTFFVHYDFYIVADACVKL
jgi:hypothetical protein